LLATRHGGSQIRQSIEIVASQTGNREKYEHGGYCLSKYS